VNVYCKPGQGTTMKVYLPYLAEVDTDADEFIDNIPSGDGDEIIMLIEDEPASAIADSLREPQVASRMCRARAERSKVSAPIWDGSMLGNLMQSMSLNWP
jgi:hypothetical protein